MAEPEQTLVVTLSTRQAKRLYRAQHLIWVWFGLAVILAAIQFFVDPRSVDNAAIYRQLHAHWVIYLWNVGFLIGGVCVALGTWMLWHRVEFVGHWFLSGAILSNLVAVLATIQGGPTVATLAGAALASATRGYWLYRVQSYRALAPPPDLREAA